MSSERTRTGDPQSLFGPFRRSARTKVIPALTRRVAAAALTGTLLLTGAPVASTLPLTPPPARAAGLQDTRDQLTAAKARLRAQQEELDKLALNYAQAENRLEETQDALAKVRASLDQARADYTVLQARLQDRLRAIYKEGGGGILAVLESLFSGDISLSGLLNRLEMLGRVAQGDQNLFSEVEAHVAKLAALQADLANRKAQEERQLAELDQANQTAMQALESIREEYNALRAQVRKLEEQERKRKEEEAKRLAAERARKAAAVATSRGGTGTRSGSSSGGSGGKAVATSGWVFPVDGPNSFINDWGFPRSGGRTHKGTDIMTGRNTPVVAVVAGTIGRTNPTERGLGGITIWLNGDDGNSYYYAHLTSIAGGISKGVRVSAGQVIGYAGNTGNARGGEVHLHFEIHPGGGAAINPYPTLVANR